MELLVRLTTMQDDSESGTFRETADNLMTERHVPWPDLFGISWALLATQPESGNMAHVAV